MTILVLLFLVLGPAAKAYKTSSDNTEIFTVLRRNHMAFPVSRPCMDNIATPGRGSKNVLFVNILEARKLRKRYLLEKEKAASRARLFRKLTNMYVRYLQKKEKDKIIKQAVLQALNGGVNPPPPK